MIKNYYSGVKCTKGKLLNGKRYKTTVLQNGNTTKQQKDKTAKTKRQLLQNGKRYNNTKKTANFYFPEIA